MVVFRAAARSDIPALTTLIEHSVRESHRDAYTPALVELALANIYGVDSALIDDGTYFVGEAAADIVACGGWSKRSTLYGGDRAPGRTDELLNPGTAAAKIRAFYVRPDHMRRGLASMLLERCEREAVAAGFRRVELASTLNGVAFYAARGYVEVGRADVPLPHGETLPVMLMVRRLA